MRPRQRSGSHLVPMERYSEDRASRKRFSTIGIHTANAWFLRHTLTCLSTLLCSWRSLYSSSDQEQALVGVSAAWLLSYHLKAAGKWPLAGAWARGSLSCEDLIPCVKWSKRNAVNKVPTGNSQKHRMYYHWEITHCCHKFHLIWIQLIFLIIYHISIVTGAKLFGLCSFGDQQATKGHCRMNLRPGLVSSISWFWIFEKHLLRS